jgi:hypothetical protein
MASAADAHSAMSADMCRSSAANAHPSAVLSGTAMPADVHPAPAHRRAT